MRGKQGWGPCEAKAPQENTKVVMRPPKKDRKAAQVLQNSQADKKRPISSMQLANKMRIERCTSMQLASKIRIERPHSCKLPENGKKKRFFVERAVEKEEQNTKAPNLSKIRFSAEKPP